MSTPLQPFIDALEKQAEILGIARNSYLSKEAERKHLEATLIKAAEGKSHAEKTINAHATQEYLVFHKELNRLEAIMEFQKLKYEVLDKEWLAQYSAQKSDQGLIRRQG